MSVYMYAVPATRPLVSDYAARDCDEAAGACTLGLDAILGLSVDEIEQSFVRVSAVNTGGFILTVLETHANNKHVTVHIKDAKYHDQYGTIDIQYTCTR